MRRAGPAQPARGSRHSLSPTAFDDAAFHHLPIEDVLARVSASRTGLSEAEVAARLERWGSNRLPEPKGKTLVGVFVAQFKSPFIYLLLAAAVSLGLGHLTDALFIFAVLLLNAVIGTYQEWRAETSARALKALIKGSVAAWRDHRLVRLPTEALVPGDLVQLESGESIAADQRLTEAQNLTADESLLTGESLAVHKVPSAAVALDAPLAENSAVDGGVVVARMLESKGNFGFDAAQKQYVDLVEAGIIDPTKVVRIALENAVSIASVLLLTEATMTEIPDTKRERTAEPELAM